MARGDAADIDAGHAAHKAFHGEWHLPAER